MQIRYNGCIVASMYDIHCHILPDLDDGPKTLEDAVAMARIAAADGTHTIIATPHGEQVVIKGGKEALNERVRSFAETLRTEGIDLRINTGVEYFLDTALLQQAKEGRVVTLNGSRYVLVELDFHQWSPHTEEAFFQLQLAGYIPVLAHPERQANIQQSPERLESLVERGVLSEVTAGSLLGEFGDRAQGSAEELVRRGLVHFIASDGHSPLSNRRPPVMADARDALAELAGQRIAELLAVANPLAVVNGKPVTFPEPLRTAKARRFLWFGRK